MVNLYEGRNQKVRRTDYVFVSIRNHYYIILKTWMDLRSPHVNSTSLKHPHFSHTLFTRFKYSLFRNFCDVNTDKKSVINLKGNLGFEAIIRKICIFKDALNSWSIALRQWMRVRRAKWYLCSQGSSLVLYKNDFLWKQKHTHSQLYDLLTSPRTSITPAWHTIYCISHIGLK